MLCRLANSSVATDLIRFVAPSSSGSSSPRIWSFEPSVGTYLPVYTVYYPRRRASFEFLTIIEIVVTLVRHILRKYARGCSFSELPVNLGVKWCGVCVTTVSSEDKCFESTSDYQVDRWDSSLFSALSSVSYLLAIHMIFLPFSALHELGRWRSAVK